MKNQEQQTKWVHSHFDSEHVIDVYNGDTLSLVFYDASKSGQDLWTGFFRTPTFFLNGTVHVLTDVEFHNKAVRDKKHIYLEMERIVSESTRKVNYFSVLFNFLVVFWLTWATVIQVYPVLLYGLPFWLQVIGIVGLTVFFCLPVIVYFVYNLKMSMVKNLYKGLLLYRISNKEFYRTFKQYRKDHRKNIWSLSYFSRSKKFMQNAAIRNAIPFLLIIFFFMFGYIITLGNASSYSFSENLTLLSSLSRSISLTPTIISTEYEFVEQQENPAGQYLIRCGDLWCEGTEPFLTEFYDDSFELLEFDEICLEDNSCIKSYIDPYILVGSLSNEDNTFVMWDPKTESILFELSLDDMGLSNEYEKIITFYGTYDDVLGSFYLIVNASSEHIEDTVFLMKRDDNGIWSKIELSKTVTNIAIYENQLYLTYNDDEDRILNIYSQDLELQDTSVIVDPFFGSDVVVFQDELYYVANDLLLQQIYRLDDPSKLNEVYRMGTIAGHLQFGDNQIYTTYTNLDNYIELDSSFHIINKGLICNECTMEERMENYVFVPIDNSLYGLSNDTILRFDRTGDVQKTITQSVIPNMSGYLILGLAIVVNTFLVLGSISKKQQLNTLSKIELDDKKLL